MSDDSEFIYANSPEELAQKVQDAHRLMRDKMRDEHHRVLEFVEALSPEQLGVLETLLHRASHSPEVALRMASVAATVAHYKSDGRVCLCGEDHQAEIDEMLKQSQERHPSSQAQGWVQGESVQDALNRVLPFPAPINEQNVAPDDTEPTLMEQGLETPEQNAARATEYRQNCELYNVTPLQPWDEAEDRGFVRCNGCDTEYISLADRAIKMPDDCHGCQLKSAHG